MLDDFLIFSPIKLSAEVKKRTPAAVEMDLRLEDAERAHLELDRIGVPRVIGGVDASLTARVSYLDGLLASATLYIAHLQEPVYGPDDVCGVSAIDAFRQSQPSPSPLPVVEGQSKRGA